MKNLSKSNKFCIALFAAYIITFFCIAAYYIWIQYDNEQLRESDLSQAVFEDGVYHFDDFTVTIGPRGGASGSWLKDPILDEAGNQIHPPCVGTIYEIMLTNTSKAKITDWKAEVYIPELLWINNAWNGILEFKQTTSGELLTQVLDLREYTSTGIDLDYYVDHTGPMIAMNPGDSFIYHPSAADNEMPLDAPTTKREVKIDALVGFIVYLPNQSLDYITSFDQAQFSYYLERNAWTSPLFITLVALDILWLVAFIAMVISQLRIRKLLRQQKHDAQIIEQSINTFINFIEAKDPSTKGHSERVAKIAYALAVDAGYSPRECNRIYYIALMHDCGKISIPANILRKPGLLTADEYEIIKSHTTYGEKMLRDFTSIDGISLGVLYHHERFDGTGYPTGLSGENIPMIARIICVADALDAMNSSRCYRPQMTKEQILNELEVNKGKQFDPVVVDSVLKLIKQNTIVVGENE